MASPKLLELARVHGTWYRNTQHGLTAEIETHTNTQRVNIVPGTLYLDSSFVEEFTFFIFYFLYLKDCFCVNINVCCSVAFLVCTVHLVVKTNVLQRQIKWFSRTQQFLPLTLTVMLARW